MAINKVTYFGKTLIDLTGDTVTADTLAQGYTAHAADGSVITGTMAKTIIYGYDKDIADSNPATRISYPSDVDNADFESAYMDSNEDVFHYGGWKDAFFMPKPCMLYTSGIVAYYLDPDDYSKKEDGTDSDVADLTFDGNAMDEWPLIHVKRWESDGVYHFRCSNVKVDDDYECWSNYNKYNAVVQHFYTPLFNGCYDSDGKLRSISGQYYGISKNTTYEMNAAALNGDGYTIDTYSDRMLINDLLVLMGKSTNSQNVFGQGHCEALQKTSVLDVTRENWESGDIDTTGAEIEASYKLRYAENHEIVASKSYRIFLPTGQRMRLHYYDSDGNYVSSSNWLVNFSGFNTPADIAYYRAVWSPASNDNGEAAAYSEDAITNMLSEAELRKNYYENQTANQYETGGMNQKGMFWGNTKYGWYGVKVFGMENWWAEQWRRIAGLIIDNGVVKVKATRGVKDGSTATDYNTSGDGYLELYTLDFSNGWQKTITTFAHGILPSAVGGSSSTYECDYIWINAAIVAFALAGGALSIGSHCGASFWHWSNAAGSANWSIGAALSYR